MAAQLPLLYATLHWQQLQCSAPQHMCTSSKLQHTPTCRLSAPAFAAALQEELEAHDKHQRKLEDALDQKTAELIALRKAALEHASASPMKVRAWWARVGRGSTASWSDKLELCADAGAGYSVF